jgi:toxin ParE1/3/4
VRVVWTLAAAREIERAYEYLVDLNPRAAAHVAETLRDEGNALAHFPYRGRVVPGTDMREMVASYPYIFRYRIDGDAVVILRVRHTSRRPTNP